jgi:hypothetical protein
MKFLLTVIGLCCLCSLSGCISIYSVTHSGKTLVDLSHKADAVLSAYRTPDDDIVIFVKGRFTEKEGAGEFSLLVSKAGLEMIREQSRIERSKGWVNRSYSYEAMIRPPSELKLDGWTSVRVEKENSPVFSLAQNDAYMPLHGAPAIYPLPRAPSALNRDDVIKLWGAVDIVYVDINPDGTAFRCSITPKAEPIEKTWNGKAWLPLTVPLDVVTLPAQALFGTLFVILMAGAK